MYFDTHAHYDSHKFDDDRDAVLSSLPGLGVDFVVDPGCDEASSRAAIALAEQYDFVYAAVGWHPQDLKDSWHDGGLAVIRELAKHPKVVAIGEIGLDYYWDRTYTDLQKEVLRLQLALAVELDLPVSFHDREAHGDSLAIAKEFPAVRGVFHCFSGSPEMARQLLDLGWYLGFDGPVTFKNNRKLREVLEICPLDRILIETDSPYLTPEPLRGTRNHSGNLQYINERIAEIKGVSPEEMAAITTENGRRLFRI
ncbi:MAG: TatD family hydrolase [Oscillospiraceae bacterium]|nr:TatD family hydrolase [Oscillospiraceae bacterium]